MDDARPLGRRDSSRPHRGRGGRGERSLPRRSRGSTRSPAAPASGGSGSTGPLRAATGAGAGSVRRPISAHPVTTLLHVLPGGLFLLLALLQFSPRLRSRHIQFHRYLGRFLVLAGFLAAATGLFFGIRMPYGGPGETAVIVLVSGLFLAALIQGYVAIRGKRVALHREWMSRAVAVAIGVSTVRVVGAAFDIALSPVGVRPADVFVLSLYTGWGITLGAEEFWIRYTRRRRETPILTAAPRRPSMAKQGGTG